MKFLEFDTDTETLLMLCDQYQFCRSLCHSCLLIGFVEKIFMKLDIWNYH